MKGREASPLHAPGEELPLECCFVTRLGFFCAKLHKVSIVCLGIRVEKCSTLKRGWFGGVHDKRKAREST